MSFSIVVRRVMAVNAASDGQDIRLAGLAQMIFHVNVPSYPPVTNDQAGSERQGFCHMTAILPMRQHWHY